MKYIYFGKYTSKKAFFDANLRESTIRKLYDGVKRPGRAGLRWFEIKLILLHKNCPADLRARYAKSPVWYVRLVARLNKYSWKDYAVDTALSDPKSTVRAAAIKRLHYEGQYSDNDVLESLKADTRIRNYFHGWREIPGFKEVLKAGVA